MTSYYAPTIKTMKTRFHMKLTARQSVVNWTKDAIRMNYDALKDTERVFGKKRMYQRLSEIMDMSCQELTVSAKTDSETEAKTYNAHSIDSVYVWITLKTEFGYERKLSPFGEYLQTVVRYFMETNDATWHAIMLQALRETKYNG